MIAKDNIAVIRTNDEVLPYYLLQLTCEPYITDSQISDAYNHTFESGHHVIKGHYLETHREGKDGDIYCLDVKKEDIVSLLCVIGICPELVNVVERCKGKNMNMFFLSPDLHQALCELVNQTFADY